MVTAPSGPIAMGGNSVKNNPQHNLQPNRIIKWIRDIFVQVS